MKVEAQGAATRIKKNKEVWKSLCDGVTELLRDMSATKVKLLEDGVALEYFTNAVLETSWREWWKLGDKDSANRENTTQVKEEVLQVTPGQPFNGIGREEKMEITFGEGGDCSAVSMRRFLERYKVVRNLSMRSRLTGWDSAEYRAGKLKLCLRGDAFDYLSLSSSMCEAWTFDDEQMIARLKDKFINVQAIELNILNFERCTQDGKETLSEYQTRLQRLVKEAYDGDSQRELDRKVAWKFVSGVSDERVRRRMLEKGWMKNRQEAKSLEELLKLAEVTKRTDDAVKVLGKETAVINALNEVSVAAINRAAGDQRDRHKTNSSESIRSGGSSSSKNGFSSASDNPLDYLLCFYCNRKHRGGWRHCTRRKSENPTGNHQQADLHHPTGHIEIERIFGISPYR